jgi:hypothetical protein
MADHCCLCSSINVYYSLKWFTLLQRKSEVDKCDYILEFILRSWWHNYWYYLSVLLMWVLMWVYYPVHLVLSNLDFLICAEANMNFYLLNMEILNTDICQTYSSTTHTNTWSSIIYFPNHFCICVFKKNCINGRYCIGIRRSYASIFVCPHLPHEILSLSSVDLTSVLFSRNLAVV